MIMAIRMMLLAFIIFIIYSFFHYIASPRRKLHHAHKQKKFYFLDDQCDIRRNFFVTFNGFLYEGEKYLHHEGKSHQVRSISIWEIKKESLPEPTAEDILKIEGIIKTRYPDAIIDWKNSLYHHKNT
ncbi:sigma-w pathway protein ysdB [Peribacillus sp. B-H-3]|uniref:sigma-w pathway protein ysdB n=1 Tax=Peribacillus sp. B-H-3 TaxID=3400420 RepID=UPI003B02853E